MGVALQFFSTTIDPDCSGSYYANPALPLGELPGNAQALLDALSSPPVEGTTPTAAGLRGLVQFTAAEERRPRVMVGVLITDGDPNCCYPTDGPGLGQIAGDHYSATGIRTFVVGMTGADFSVLERIAESGGTPDHNDFCASGFSSCHFYNVGNGDPAAFIEALTAIRRIALGCEHLMPEPEPGQTISPNMVKVTHTPGGTSTPQDLSRQDDQAACGPDGGWTYDDNDNPTKFIMCPATCDMLQADTNGRVDIILGCSGIQR